jgi:transposase, IS5 family
MKQTTFGVVNGSGFQVHGKETKRGLFLSRMDEITPWADWVKLIEPFYPKRGNGRPPIGLERILRMYCIANWFNLSDVACEDALYDVEIFRRFCMIDLGAEKVPDATTLMNFRHLLEAHQLGSAMFKQFGEQIQARGFKLSGGTIVDATIIEAPSSTKNEQGARDPEMQQTKKGNEWHFGLKLHIGMDSGSGLIHSATVTPANVHDSQALGHLMHGQETRLYGDSAYRGQTETIRAAAPKCKDFTNKRAYRNTPLTDADRASNKRKSSIRARVEHTFRVIKGLWGMSIVRYRGLAKNANRLFVMLAMYNMKKQSGPMTGKMRPVS